MLHRIRQCVSNAAIFKGLRAFRCLKPLEFRAIRKLAAAPSRRLQLSRQKPENADANRPATY